MDQPYPHVSPRQGRLNDDEGFSEAMDVEEAEVMSYDSTPEPIDIDQNAPPNLQQAKLTHYLLLQPTEVRAIIARELMATLPTSMLASLIREAEGRLHYDPVKHFPPEITTYLFRYLDSNDLVRSALVSSMWKACAFQPSLWKRLFALEGWTCRSDYMKAFENSIQQQLELYLAHYSRSADTNAAFQPSASSGVGSTQTGASKRLYIKDAALGAWQSDEFDGLNLNTSPLAKHSPVFIRPGSGFVCPVLHPANSWDLALGHIALNWRHLYTARRRLEENWRAGKYRTFRMPPEDNDDKHTECVYTLQFSTKYCVSGSRDRTVRVWDMESRKVIGLPLLGHRGSVLCLQFDERPDRDLIISGGSDACVFIWRFSTKQAIKHLKKAHTQAVLNLRFDDRYLVTCSKDSTIKVWSMHKITPFDAAYPATNQSRDATFPDYIIDKAAMETNPHLGLNASVDQYGLLMTLNGHNAAVNSLALRDDTIISVSGDRKIMQWELSKGAHKKTFGGHEKGIACVHYDGRRIVSGSSDETVRIFDPETTAEVAYLKGHHDLVRTIQADFGDVPGDDEKYETQARAHSVKLLQKQRQRLFQEAYGAPRDDQFVIGAKLPPGGGGNRWAKIVSGSYDETVIIWKQDKEGRWSPDKILRHEDAINATVTRKPPPPPGPPGLPPYRRPPLPLADPIGTSSARQNLRFTTDAPLQQPPVHAANQFGQGAASSGRPPIQPPANPFGQQATTSSQGLTAPLPTAPPGHASHHTHGAFDQRTSSTHASSPRADAQGTSTPNGTSSHHDHGTEIPSTPQPPSAPLAPPNASQPLPPILAQQRLHGHRHHHHHRHTHGHQHVLSNQPHLARHHADDDEEGTSRLFKLQFDARRIICCSQQPIIVGWDFAAGDRELIEASAFFGETG